MVEQLDRSPAREGAGGVSFTRVVSVVVVVIVLCLVAVAIGVLLVVTRQRLVAQTGLTLAADLLASQRGTEIAARDVALRTAELQRVEATQQALAATAAAEQAALEQAVAQAEAVAAISASESAKALAGAADTARAQAEHRAAAADARAAEVAAVGLDPHVMWALERQRVDRTWRFSVAIGPETRSVFDDVEHPLVEALRVEVAATREEAGTVVDLDVELPVAVTAAGSLLTLRTAQELLANVVRLAEQVTLTVHQDGDDVVITIAALDEHGEPIATVPLDMPPTLGLLAVPGGVRVVGAVAG